MLNTIETIRFVGFSIIFDVTKGEKVRKSVLNPHQMRKWKAHYGVSPEVCLFIWLRIRKYNNSNNLSPKLYLKHFFCTFFFLKSYETESQIGSRFNLDSKTVRKWTKFFIIQIKGLAKHLVSQ